MTARRVAASPGVELEVRESGDRGDPPVVLLHGFRRGLTPGATRCGHRPMPVTT